MNKIANALAFIILISLSACTGNGKKGVTDTPTSGKINIMVDESLQLISESQLEAFHSIYRLAKVTPAYAPEFQTYQALINDSVNFIIGTRMLKDEELEFFKKKGHKVIQQTIALDATTLIVNSKFGDSTLTNDQMKKLFTGQVTDWNQLYPNSKAGKILLVFDNQAGSTLRSIGDKFELNGKIPKNYSAVKSNPEVIKYVQSHQNAIGLISRSWISDTQDKKGLSFLKDLRIMQLEVPDTAKLKVELKYAGPYAAYLKFGAYALPRNVYIISQESYSGLHTGLRNYIALDGQIIILQMGLLPYTQQARNIKVTKTLGGE
ncbi:MAG: substrate-binding domain-containing protein [Bacteroidota bacterium]|nr:substrate-binding domain-containing protein [Bacteroidota bacterium]